MTGESADPMSDEQWKIQSLKRAFKRLWQKVDSLFIMKENNDFVRFFTAESAFEFYSSRLNNIKFEVRADQANAPSFYVGKQEI
jgi:hypothetical protein